MTTFVGRYDRQLDPKGRLALPASFRQKFESQAFLTIGENGCLEAYTPEDHDQMAQDLRDKERRREVDRNFVRTKSAKTFEMPIDAQGRVLIDSKLREFAGLELGSRVAVIGVYDRVEIWNAERFDASTPAAAPSGPRLARRLGGPTLPDGTRHGRPAERATSHHTTDKQPPAHTEKEEEDATSPWHRQCVRSSAAFRPARWKAPTPPASLCQPGRHPGGQRWPGGCR